MTLSEPDGLLAVGGDLSVARLLAAYRAGIFPWYGEDDPILWWSPDPRFVLFPERLHVAESLARIIRGGRFRVTFDTRFRGVIESCRRAPRAGETGTWITREIVEAYCALHEAGHAHSVEVWEAGELAGGLYGVTVGACFCGESMFARVPNASKVGFVALVERLRRRGFTLVDCQVPTEHLARFGAESVPRRRFLALLRAAARHPQPAGRWAEPTPDG